MPVCLCASVCVCRYGVPNTCLSPLVSEELLDYYNCFCSGAAIETGLGFQYAHPLMSRELVRQSLSLAVEAGVFPNILVEGRPLLEAADHKL
jgi:hypothetical protein